MSGFGEREVVLEHPHDDAPQEVDRGDDHSGHGIALDELRGAVHRAVEVGFAGDLRPSAASLLIGDETGIEVGVDRHLLAGHGVEGEARAHLGDAPSAVGDHHELNHDEDQEDHEAHDHVSADDELSEGLHDASGVARRQDQPGDRHVDRESEHRGQQQQAREGGEVQGLVEVHRHDEDGERRGDVQRDQQIEQRRRERYDEHRHDDDHAHRRDQVGVAQHLTDPLQAHSAYLLRRAMR